MYGYIEASRLVLGLWTVVFVNAATNGPIVWTEVLWQQARQPAINQRLVYRQSMHGRINRYVWVLLLLLLLRFLSIQMPDGDVFAICLDQILLPLPSSV
jgi:uncharacterized membrane protein